MSFFKIVIGDLHLADGHPILDGFGDRQQSSFEGLLSAVAATGNHEGPTYRDAEDVELIINGDCFDYLAILPYKTDGVTDSSTVAEKLEKMIVAHGPFFTVLRRFVAQPGRHVTFISGNQDIELGFEELRIHIREAIAGSVD
jgi:UDP-2,3-diacylglucosamine pyrophosphatase LpxH